MAIDPGTIMVISSALSRIVQGVNTIRSQRDANLLREEQKLLRQEEIVERRQMQRDRWESERAARAEHALQKMQELRANAEINRNYSDWPFNNITPSHIKPREDAVPLHIVLTPVSGCSDAFSRSVEHSVFQFMAGHYPDSASERPVSVLTNEWRAEAPAGRGAVIKLHAHFGAVPFLIIEGIRLETGVAVQIGYWEAGQNRDFYHPVGIIPYEQIGGSENLSAELLGAAYRLIAATAADMHHLRLKGVIPLVPALLPELIEDVQERLPTIATHLLASYRQNYNEVFASERLWIPDRLLELAEAVERYVDQETAREHCLALIACFGKVRGVDDSIDPKAVLTTASFDEDAAFLSRLQVLTRRLGMDELADHIVDLLARPATDNPTPRRSRALPSPTKHLKGW